jgi:hypothetical protein
MHISEKREKLIAKSKKIARHGVYFSLVALVLSFAAGVFIFNGTVVNILGNISVLSGLFFALSVVCLLLLQIEAWEKDYL